MKKITTMRIASILLIAVLMTTCAISGTFAKYVTTDNGTDSARVAKWGVQVQIANDLNLFGESYVKDDQNVTNVNFTNTVEVNTAGTNLVAPGTKNTITFTISGAPEVAVDVAVVMNVRSDVVIPRGTDIKQGNPNDTDEANANANTLGDDYTPVVFTLKKSGDTTIATGTLTQIKAGLESLSAKYGPNTTLNETYTLSWEWAFEGEGVNDAADTYLGNVAAGLVDDDDTSTAIAFDFSITVTQID